MIWNSGNQGQGEGGARFDWRTWPWGKTDPGAARGPDAGERGRIQGSRPRRAGLYYAAQCALVVQRATMWVKTRGWGEGRVRGYAPGSWNQSEFSWTVS